MEAEELLAVWKSRRNEIVEEALSRLGSDLRQEYDRLEAAIPLAEEQLANGASEASIRTPRPRRQGKGKISLAERKETLISYFKEHGRATRTKLINETAIPPGSVGRLLQEHEFDKDGNGQWGLAKE